MYGEAGLFELRNRIIRSKLHSLIQTCLRLEQSFPLKNIYNCLYLIPQLPLIKSPKVAPKIHEALLA